MLVEGVKRGEEEERRRYKAKEREQQRKRDQEQQLMAQSALFNLSRTLGGPQKQKPDSASEQQPASALAMAFSGRD